MLGCRADELFVILALGVGNVVPALQSMIDDALRLATSLVTGG